MKWIKCTIRQPKVGQKIIIKFDLKKKNVFVLKNDQNIFNIIQNCSLLYSKKGIYGWKPYIERKKKNEVISRRKHGK